MIPSPSVAILLPALSAITAVMYAILFFWRPPPKLLKLVLIILTALVVTDTILVLSGIYGYRSMITSQVFVLGIFWFQYFTFVRSRAYCQYCMLPVHRHIMAILVILLSVGLEVFLLLYFFSRDQWLLGLGLMLLVVGLSAYWLIRWYRASLPGESIEVPKN